MKIKTGDKLPYAEFFYLDKENIVKIINTTDLFQNKKTIILGMPGAFTKVCSAKHLPGYVKNFENAKKKGVEKIVCISVNDPNVMKAWGESQNVKDKIFMAGDPFCKFTKSIGAEVDKSEKGLGIIYFVGPTMGYLTGFLVAGFLAGYFKFSKSYFLNFLKLIIAVSTIYLFGMLWLAKFTGWEKVFLVGAQPFLLAELFKIIIHMINNLICFNNIFFT